VKAVTTKQIRELDRSAIAAGIPLEQLMERAGQAIANAVIRLLKRQQARRVLLLAGKGNNGGDTAVAARHLTSAGFESRLVWVETEGLPSPLPPADVIVDGLLGTGLAGDIREPYAAAICAINAANLPVVAVDMPSGLDSDTGQPHGLAVRADLTVTMGLPKIGLLKPAAVDFVGQLEVADIGFPQAAVNEIASDVELITAGDIAPLLPRWPRSAHKGATGHVGIFAGSEGYTGAPVLCAAAAARTGVGLVTLSVPRGIYPIVAANCPPEIMPHPLDSYDAPPANYLGGLDAAALGPGLGLSRELQQFVRWLLPASQIPMVLDADALTALAAQGAGPLLRRTQTPLVLTPHPGEMARLANVDVKAVQADRWGTTLEFANEHKVLTVLKGTGTVIADGSGKLWINMTGNPGMAKGGMGDALTGIIAALLAQGLEPLDAARAGVFLHGLAGDLAAERCGQRAMLATDLIANLGAAFNSVR
jgi:NAD(P)H-hydrate epimerase